MAGSTGHSTSEKTIIDRTPHLVAVDRQFARDSHAEAEHLPSHHTFHPPLPTRPRKLASYLRSRLLKHQRSGSTNTTHRLCSTADHHSSLPGSADVTQHQQIADPVTLRTAGTGQYEQTN